MTGPLGTPRHWWPMVGNTLSFYETDIGDAAAKFHFGPAASEPPTKFNYRQAGLTADDNLSGNVNYSIKYIGETAFQQKGALYGDIPNNSLFADDTKGSLFLMWKGSGALAKNHLWSTHPDNAAFNIYLTSAGALVFQVIGGASAKTLTSPSAGLNNDAKHMLVLTQAGAGAQTKMYIDGYEVTPTASTSGSPPADAWWKFMRDNALAGRLIFLFASMRYDTSDTPWIGHMQHVGVFDEILSAAQIEQMWLRSFGDAPTGVRYPRRRVVA